MSPTELILAVTICATLASLCAKQLQDAKNMEVRKRLDQIVQADEWRRQYAHEILDSPTQQAERPAPTAEEIADLLLELEEIDPEAAALLIQQLGKLPAQQ